METREVSEQSQDLRNSPESLYSSHGPKVPLGLLWVGGPHFSPTE